MIGEQSEFDFMKNYISKVSVLDYIGGQDEDLGGYCEPLIIEYFDGMEQYVLHRMYQSRGRLNNGEIDWGKVVNNHEKAIFFKKSDLIDNWIFLRDHLGWTGNRPVKWEKTNAVCGCECSSEKFYETKRIDLKEQIRTQLKEKMLV